MEARIAERIPPPAGGAGASTASLARWTAAPDSEYVMVQTNLASPGEIVDEPRHAERYVHHVASVTREDYILEDGSLSTRLPSGCA